MRNQGPVPKANLGAPLSFHNGLDDSRTRNTRNAACRSVGALTAQACEWDNWQRVEGLGLCVFFCFLCLVFHWLGLGNLCGPKCRRCGGQGQAKRKCEHNVLDFLVLRG